MTQVTQEKQKDPNRALLTKKSKIFKKVKFMVSKSCPLGPACIMICCISWDAHSQKHSFLRGLSTEFIFFNFSDIATYHRKHKNQNHKLLIFLEVLLENSHSVKATKKLSKSSPSIPLTLTNPTLSCPVSLLKSTPPPSQYPWVSGGWYVTPEPRSRGLVLAH